MIKNKMVKTTMEMKEKQQLKQGQGFFSFVFQSYEHQYNEVKSSGSTENMHAQDNVGLLVNLKE